MSDSDRLERIERTVESIEDTMERGRNRADEQAHRARVDMIADRLLEEQRERVRQGIPEPLPRRRGAGPLAVVLIGGVLLLGLYLLFAS